MSFLKRLGFGSAISDISPLDAFNGQKAGDIIIIDVRDPREWAQTGCPKGSQRICMNDPALVESVKKLLAQHPEATIAVSCKSGMRATSAAKTLQADGIENLRVLTGGIIQWSSEGLPLDHD